MLNKAQNSRMLKHLWGEPLQAHFESLGYSHTCINPLMTIDA